MRRLPLIAVLGLFGCRPQGLAAIKGSWRSSKGTDFTFDGTANFRAVVHRNGKDVPETGTVTASGDGYTLNIDSVKGRSIADIKAALERRAGNLTPRLQAVTEAIGKPEFFRLGSDGHTLTKQGTTKIYVLTQVQP